MTDVIVPIVFALFRADLIECLIPAKHENVSKVLLMQIIYVSNVHVTLILTFSID